jgi:hypothetical protein
VLDDFATRLSASIRGVNSSEIETWSQVGANNNLPEEVLPDIYRRFEPYLGWLEKPEILSLRFEDFIRDRDKTVGKVFDHAVRRGFVCNHSRVEAIRTITDNINPHHSPTFRSGVTGGWRSAFTPEHKDLFKQVSGNLLQRLGYEASKDW